MNTSDFIFITDLKAPTIIGVYPWERKIKQIIQVDLEIGVSPISSTCEDKLENVLDYEALAKEATLFIEQQEAKLLETLGQRLAEHLLGHEKIRSIKLKLTKRGAIANATNSGIIIERSKK